MALIAACGGPLVLRVGAGDLEPWPDGFRVVQSADVVEGPAEGESGPEREASLWVLESDDHDSAEEAAAAIRDHLEARGWRLGPTFDTWPSYVGVLDDPATIVMVGVADALLAASAPANAAGAGAVDRASTGEVRVVVEVIAR